MFNHYRIRMLLVALAVIVLLASATAAFAGGMSVEPGEGSYGTPFVARADGFNPNEGVSVWVTLSNGSTIALPTTQADSAGSVEFDVTPELSWRTGQVIVVAHGISSDHEYFAKFNLDVGTAETTSSTVSGSLLSDPPGLTLYYRGSGYKPGELVSAWFQYPGELNTSAAHGLANVTADAAGNVIFAFTLQTNSPYGGYHITAKGAESKHVTYNTFSYFGTISDHRTDWADSGYVVSSVTATALQWYGQYFSNATLSGTPVLLRTDADLNFNWGAGSPAVAVPADNFSVRWTTTGYIATAGNYTLTATADDGIRVWVDGQLVIDEWHDQSATTYSVTGYLGAGSHTMQVEYYENTGDAVVSVEIVGE